MNEKKNKKWRRSQTKKIKMNKITVIGNDSLVEAFQKDGAFFSGCWQQNDGSRCKNGGP